MTNGTYFPRPPFPPPPKKKQLEPLPQARPLLLPASLFPSTPGTFCDASRGGGLGWLGGGVRGCAEQDPHLGLFDTCYSGRLGPSGPRTKVGKIPKMGSGPSRPWDPQKSKTELKRAKDAKKRNANVQFAFPSEPPEPPKPRKLKVILK